MQRDRPRPGGSSDPPTRVVTVFRAEGAPTDPLGTRSVSLRRQLDGTNPLVGVWINLADAASVDIIAACGFAWIGIDLQHGTATADLLHHLVDAARSKGCATLVRVPGQDTTLIQRALDAGAQGVIIPTVNNAEEARAVAAACRYPPEGTRSYGPFRSSLRYPVDTPTVSNYETVCAVMIETRMALANLDSILAVPGVDAAFVGPYDLALSMGCEIEQLMSTNKGGVLTEILSACTASGTVPGIYAGDPQAALPLIEAGYRLVAATADSTLLATACAAVTAALQDAHSPDGNAQKPAKGANL